MYSLHVKSVGSNRNGALHVAILEPVVDLLSFGPSCLGWKVQSVEASGVESGEESGVESC